MPPVIDKNRPAMQPPQDVAIAGTDTATGPGAPTLDVAELTAAAGTSPAGVPEVTPPSEITAAVAAGEGIGAWHNSQKITSLWCNASARNAWVAVEGLGWRRIAPQNDSSFVALTAMLSHARQMNSTCNLRIEADNNIHEAYVW